MSFAIIPIIGLLLILIGIYKRKESYGKMFFVIGALFLLLTSYIVYKIKFESSSEKLPVECGYWNEIGVKKECNCTGGITTSGNSGGKFYCSGECLKSCVCHAPYKTDDSSMHWEGVKEINCDELEKKIFKGYYGEEVIFNAVLTPQKL